MVQFSVSTFSAADCLVKLYSRTAVAFVASNLLASWLGVVFWFGVGGAAEGPAGAGAAAVLVHMYRAADARGLALAWPLLVFATLFLSAVITMVS